MSVDKILERIRDRKSGKLFLSFMKAKKDDIKLCQVQMMDKYLVKISDAVENRQDIVQSYLTETQHTDWYQPNDAFWYRFCTKLNDEPTSITSQLFNRDEIQLGILQGDVVSIVDKQEIMSYVSTGKKIEKFNLDASTAKVDDFSSLFQEVGDDKYIKEILTALRANSITYYSFLFKVFSMVYFLRGNMNSKIFHDKLISKKLKPKRVVQMCLVDFFPEITKYDNRDKVMKYIRAVISSNVVKYMVDLKIENKHPSHFKVDVESREPLPEDDEIEKCQVEKWELSTRLQTAEDNLKAKIEETKRVASDGSLEINEKNKLLQHLSIEKASALEDINKLQADITNKNEQLHNLEQENTTIKHNVDSLISKFEEERNMLEKRYKQIQDEMKKTDDETVDKLIEQLHGLEQENTSLKQKLTDIDKQLSKMSEEKSVLEKQSEQKDEFKNKISSLNDDIAKLSSEKEQLFGQFHGIEEENTSLKQKLTDITSTASEVPALKQSLSDINIQMIKMNEEKIALEKQCEQKDEFKNKISSLNDDIAKLSSEKEQLEKLQTTLRIELEKECASKLKELPSSDQNKQLLEEKLSLLQRMKELEDKREEDLKNVRKLGEESGKTFEQKEAEYKQALNQKMEDEVKLKEQLRLEQERANKLNDISALHGKAIQNMLDQIGKTLAG